MSFSKSQMDAVTHGEGPCLVLAGPGSGKTLTIVNRIKHLIEERKVRPEEILVITFTKYAAKEMKSRFQQIMGNKMFPVTVGTFHGVYYGILKWAYHFGPQNLLSEEEKYKLIRQAVGTLEMEIFDEEDFIRDIGADISTAKNNSDSLEELSSDRCSPDDFRRIYEAYEKRRKEARKIDFDDMLVLCFELFNKRPDILKLWQEKFSYILIDEFQDINKVQYDVIKMLAEPKRNLFAVGDDDQAIYGFRGADSRLMFQFKKDYPGLTQLLLDMNYRSTSNIVENALKVIGHNEVRFQKEIRPGRKKGLNVHVQEVRDPREESLYMLKDIQERIQGGVTPENIAVLYRIHTDARPLVETLIEQGIAFSMKEQIQDIFHHFIAKDMLAYFKMARGEASRQDFLQVMNKPLRYISRESLVEEGCLFQGIQSFYGDKDWMAERIEQFEWDVKILNKMAPYAAIQYIRKKIGYDEYLREYAGSRRVEADSLFDILDEIGETMRPFANLGEWILHVKSYSLALKQRQSNRETNQSGIRLLTMHAAKGLEFDTVYIVGANEGQMPYKKALKGQGVEEERRLFYVAMTRAKELLKIIYVKEKNGKAVSPSRFIDELLKV